MKIKASELTEDYVLTQFAEASMQGNGEDWNKWAWLLEHKWPEKYAQERLEWSAEDSAISMVLKVAEDALGEEPFKKLCEAILATERKTEGVVEKFLKKGKANASARK